MAMACDMGCGMSMSSKTLFLLVIQFCVQKVHTGFHPLILQGTSPSSPFTGKTTIFLFLHPHFFPAKQTGVPGSAAWPWRRRAFSRHFPSAARRPPRSAPRWPRSAASASRRRPGRSWNGRRAANHWSCPCLGGKMQVSWSDWCFGE